MSRDDYVQQGKQFANDLRDTASKKVADNETSILGAVGKAARWVDAKTGGKYADKIGKAEAKVGEGVGRVARQGTGEPQGPGASAGDGTEPVTPPSGGTEPVTPPSGGTHGPTAKGPGASAGPAEPSTGPVGPPSPSPDTPSTTPPTTPPGRSTKSPRDDTDDWPRPPQT